MNLTQETRTNIIESLRRGNTLAHTLKLVGYPRSSFYAKMAKEAKLAREVQAARLHAREFVDSAYQKLIRAGKERTIIHAVDRLDRQESATSYVDSLITAQQKAIANQDWELSAAIQEQIESESE